MPTGKLVLEVDLYADRSKVKTSTRTYQRVFLDEDGKEITQDYRVMLDSKRLLSDNRLRPGEPRVERFVVSVPREGRLRAEARLRYLYEPELFSRTKMSILMASEKTPWFRAPERGTCEELTADLCERAELDQNSGGR